MDSDDPITLARATLAAAPCSTCHGGNENELAVAVIQQAAEIRTLVAAQRIHEQTILRQAEQLTALRGTHSLD